MRPGDIILGGADGVVVIPREHAPEILGKAQAAIAKEQQLRKRVEQGEFIFDILARFSPGGQKAIGRNYLNHRNSSV